MTRAWKFAQLVLLASGLGWGAAPAIAQDYPLRPVTLVVPFPPGGPTDLFARRIAIELSKALGKQVVVENRAGAGGVVGSQAVARAAPDGYTLLMATTGTHAINATLYPKAGYDPVRDFAPICTVSRTANLLVVNPAVPAKTVKELIALAKSKPGALTVASAGSGTTIHLSAELFKAMTQTDMMHVPFKGTSGALTDLIAGRVDVMFDNFSTAWPQVKAGRLRALAVTSARRNSAAPDLPTIAEAGVPGYEATVWFGVVAPAGTPDAVVKRLNAEIRKALETSAVRDRFAAEGAEPFPLSPAEFADLIKADIARWGEAVRRSGARVE